MTGLIWTPPAVECEGYTPYVHDPRWPVEWPSADTTAPPVYGCDKGFPIEPCLSTPPESFAWPGGYTIRFDFFDEYGSNEATFCAKCAGKYRDISAFESSIDHGETTPVPIKPWRGHRNDYPNPVILSSAYDEGPDLPCDDCGAMIESSYGDPNEKPKPKRSKRK